MKVKDYKDLQDITLIGSCAKLDTQLVIANRRKYITRKKIEELAEDINHESRMLASLINKL